MGYWRDYDTAAGEAVNVNLAAVRAGESSQVSRQVIGIVREGIRVRAAYDERVGVR